MEIYCKDDVQPADTTEPYITLHIPAPAEDHSRHVTQDEGETPELTMRPVSVLLLSLLSAAFILISAYKVPPTTTTRPCEPDKVYKERGGCKTYCNDPKKSVCDRKGRPGCYCKEGLLELDGKCIKKEDCEACTGNRTYTSCGGCPYTCSNWKDLMCTAHCRLGCFCNEDYVTNATGHCILIKDCPK
ncbi:zonadhesin-like [Eleutherodactylus coqui]|uniref:zonadhesin-like n=1 Tax=Eleutherodactylus coqui TaxID=57060 RepID=UPI003462A98C